MMQSIKFGLSSAVKQTARSPIAEAYQWASAYAPTETRPLLDMAQGVPGVPPPSELLDALGKCASDPRAYGYCPTAGERKLREALAMEMTSVYGKRSDVEANDVTITAGCNMAFCASMMSVAQAGDEVILPVPWYFNHEMTLKMLGIHTIPLHLDVEMDFQPTVGACEKLITPKTKALVLVSPNNPTGAIYSPDCLASLALFAREAGIALIIDETYRDFVAGPPHSLFTPGSICQDWTWRSTLIHLFSFSKSYSIPGHRLGAIVASPEVLDEANTILDCLQICAPRSVQLAIYPLLSQLRPFVQVTAQALVHRHELFKSLLPHGWTIGSQGAYYAFVEHPFKHMTALDLCKQMAMKGGIVTLPVDFFTPSADGSDCSHTGIENRWIRFSVANVNDESIRQVCERLRKLPDELGWKGQSGSGEGGVKCIDPDGPDLRSSSL